MSLIDEFPKSWENYLSEKERSALAEIEKTLNEQEAAGHPIFPGREHWFRALSACKPEEVRVVILGQDPYHGAGQANGLAFSVPRGVPLPPSLRNIFKELASDVGVETPTHGDLSAWAAQGVLLLNRVLTVEERVPGAHTKLGWRNMTQVLLEGLLRERTGLVVMLWGREARKGLPTPPAGRHCYIVSSHPSPRSAHRGFRGKRFFSQANDYLSKHEQAPIDWRIPD